MKILENSTLAALIIGIISASVVGGAWLFEIAGYLPCQLCLWQRIPYYIIAPILIAVGLLGSLKIAPSGYSRIATLFAFFVFLISAVLAAYHSGVEWTLWEGPSSCGASVDFTTQNAADLLNALSATRPPSCNDAAGRFIGLSFAGWNFVASIGLALMSFATFSAARRKYST